MLFLIIQKEEFSKSYNLISSEMQIIKSTLGKILHKISNLRGKFFPNFFIKTEQFFLERNIEIMQGHNGYASFSKLLRANIPPGAKVLDVGCNKGLESLIISKTNNVIGIDLYEEFVNEAKKRGVNAQVMDFHNISFNEEFDCVFSNNSLEHSPYPEKVIQGMRKALKQNGLLVIGLPLDGNNPEVKDPAHFFRTTENEMTSMLEEHNFTILKKEIIDTKKLWNWENLPALNKMFIAVAKKS